MHLPDEEQAPLYGVRKAAPHQNIHPEEHQWREAHLATHLCIFFTILPFLTFVAPILVVTFLYHDFPFVTFTLLALLIVLTLGAFCLPHTMVVLPPVLNFIYHRIVGRGMGDRQSVDERGTKDSRRQANLLLRDLGVYMALFAGAGIICAFHNYAKNSRESMAIVDLHRYSNVFAGNSASGFQDAVKLDFVPGTKVDTFDSVGYKLDGTVYCVAPIKDAYTGQVNFWAVGTNCCAKRNNFKCGDATVGSASSGFVLPVKQPGFKQAVKVATEVYNLATPSDYLLVQWTSDFNAIKLNFADNATSFGGYSTLTAFGLALLVGVFTSGFRLRSIRDVGFQAY